jgi:hypothetical protein
MITQPQTLHLDNLIADVYKSSKIFGVLYQKKSGEITKFNARFGVTKYLRGGKRTVPQSMYVVWDNNRKGYRTIAPEGIISISFKKSKYVKLENWEFVKL